MSDKEHILAELRRLYPEAKPELHFSNPYETLVATMLSAQCTDKQVNKVTEKLFPLFPDAFAMAKLSAGGAASLYCLVRLSEQGGQHYRRLPHPGRAVRRPRFRARWKS